MQNIESKFEFFNPQVAELYQWSTKDFDERDYINDIHLNIFEVLQAHFMIAEVFIDRGTGIGGVGVKDMNLLKSALSRQNACFGGVCKYQDTFEIAASLMYGLVKNHPFYDANKRTAFLSIIYYLYKNNYIPSVSHKEFEDFLVDVAEGNYIKKPRYRKLLKKYPERGEVKYIAWYLKRNTRKIDKKEYLLSYRELKKVLSSHGYELRNPSGNSIGIYKLKKPSKKFFWKEKDSAKKKYVKVGTIPFPGDNKQVAKPELKKIRDLTGLTPQNGYDSQVFYREVSPLSHLLLKYQEPLRRLADR